MGFKGVLIFLSALFIIQLLFFYWVVPLRELDFSSEPKNFSFNIGKNDSLQFYPNMRFADRNIGYSISKKCTLQKQQEMKEAFDILEQKTLLNFYSSPNPQIEISCGSRQKIENGMFIAGEGGPKNITFVGKYSLILEGEISLIRASNCPTPNIALHELLHVLGFKHSNNPNNIMYNYSNCKQEIGKEIINLLNSLYKEGGLPDLVFKSALAKVHGRFLDVNFSISNFGLIDAPASEIEINIKNSTIKKINIKPLKTGYGLVVSMANIKVPRGEIQEIEMNIKTNFKEINKKNNKIKLKIN